MHDWAMERRTCLLIGMVDRAEDNKGLFAVLKTIFKTMFHLPTRIGAICRIWFFAWIGTFAELKLPYLKSHESKSYFTGWFPFMLYSTTFVGEVLQRYDTALRDSLEKSSDVVGDIARVGAMALVIYSSISLAASFSLPWLIHSPESEVLRRSRSGKQGMLYGIIEFLELYRPDLATAWFIGHIMFAVAMFLTLFIRTVAFATFVVGSCGM